jgi:hypothetical protein
MPKIEKTVSKHKGFSVVEKYGKIPSVEDIDKTLSTIANSV